jgi:membrane protease YdiL (CAAX protease family)
MDYMLEFMNSLPSEIYIVFLASSALYIVGAIIYCRCFEKRKLFSLGFNKRGIISEYLSGLLLGSLMLAIPALACLFTGCVSFSPDPSASPLIIVLFFVAFVLQGMGEEVLFRGYLMTSLTRRHSPWFAIIVSALTFSFFHIPNANFSIIAFINIVLFGIFTGVFMLKRGSIWAVAAIHTAWNFLQGNVFGISVSGNPKFSSVLSSTNAEFGTILSGGEFGLEGGLGATVVLLIALLLALIMPPKKSELDENSSEQGANEKA